MIITAMCTLLYYTSQVTFASVTQCEEATNSIPNRVLAGHAFFTKQSPNIEDCVMSCIARGPLCESSNYYRKTKVCELNDKTAESNPEDLMDYEWSIYMTNSVRLLPRYNFASSARKSSKIFGNLRTFSEIFRKFSGTFVWSSGQFWKIFGNLRRVVGNLRKIIKNPVISTFI